MANAIKIAGLRELHRALQEFEAKVQSTILGRALAKAATPLVAAAATNARRLRAEAEARGYKDRDAYRLYESVGQRVRAYKDGGVLFLAAGPLLKQGGFHGHLVELGHRIVVGGTLERAGKKPELTAAGKRFIEALGLSYGSQAYMRRSKSTGKIVRGSRRGYIAAGNLEKEAVLAVSGGTSRAPIIAGKLYSVGKRFRGRQVRGGGRVLTERSGLFGVRAKRTRPFPFMGPAWNQTRRLCLQIFTEELRRGIDAAARQAATKAQVM